MVNDQSAQGQITHDSQDSTKAPIPVAVVGFGNVGQYAVEAVLEAPDFKLAGIVRRDAARPKGIDSSIPVVADVEELGEVRAALLCIPTRSVPQYAQAYLSRGINTVDSYDIHGELVDVRRQLDAVGKKHGSTAVVSAGWDPGTDSMIRAIFEIMAPKGITYTNFGPGMSMGHSVVAKGVEGVKDALSLTVPIGQGMHRRLVYVELQDGAEFDRVRDQILVDPYFKNDDTRVIQVPDVRQLIDAGHGVAMERKGVSGRTHNQQFTYDMRINNPALTAQVMVSAARAGMRQQPGAYTLLEMPLIDFLPGDREDNMRRLV